MDLPWFVGRIIFSVAEHFKIDDGEDIEALFLDNHGAEIPDEKFMTIVKQFLHCGAFYVEIELLNRPNTSNAQVKVATNQQIFKDILFINSLFLLFRSFGIFWTQMNSMRFSRNIKVVDFWRKKIARNWSMVYICIFCKMCLRIRQIPNWLLFAMTCWQFFQSWNFQTVLSVEW